MKGNCLYCHRYTMVYPIKFWNDDSQEKYYCEKHFQEVKNIDEERGNFGTITVPLNAEIGSLISKYNYGKRLIWNIKDKEGAFKWIQLRNNHYTP